MKFVDALLGSSKSPARDWLVDWNRTLRRRFMETYGSQQQYDAIWKRYADELRYGRVCEFHEGGAPGAPNDRELGRLAYVSALFHSVLALIHEDYGKAPCRLNRRSHDGEPAPEPDHGAYLFDPRGGVFLCGERARRDVMRTRAAFHMSLWDLSAKMKADDIYRRVRGSELPPGQL